MHNFVYLAQRNFLVNPVWGEGRAAPLAASLEPIAVETLGVLNSSANSLLKEIGNKISLNTGESNVARFFAVH